MPQERDGEHSTGSAAAVDLYDEALDALLGYRPELPDLVHELAHDHPDFAMGQALVAYCELLTTERPAGDGHGHGHGAHEPTAFLELDRGALSDRERGHLAAAEAWHRGDLWGAGQLLGAVTIDHPRDVLAVIIGHQIDFLTGNAHLLRDRPARSLAALGEHSPRWGHVMGMWAFGLEESGDLTRAEEAGLAALDADAADVWALHAVAHVHEMRGRADQGLAFLDDWRPHWRAGHGLLPHLSWHAALFALEGGRTDWALATSDAAIAPPDGEPTAYDLVDASSLLWRLHLDGADVAARACAVADAWLRVLSPSWYVFNDVHAIMALVAADRLAHAADLVDILAERAVSRSTSTNDHMTRAVGLPVAKALVAFGQDRYDEVVPLLDGVRPYLNMFGGSHAQRDVFDRTLVVAALRDEQRALARAYLDERVQHRGGGTWNLDRLAEVLDALGDTARAASTRERADHSRQRAAAALWAIEG